MESKYNIKIRTYIPTKAIWAVAGDIKISTANGKINSIFTPRSRTPLGLPVSMNKRSNKDKNGKKRRQTPSNLREPAIHAHLSIACTAQVPNKIGHLHACTKRNPPNCPLLESTQIHIIDGCFKIKRKGGGGGQGIILCIIIAYLKMATLRGERIIHCIITAYLRVLNTKHTFLLSST